MAMIEPKIPDPDDKTKYPKIEIREQPGVSAGQSKRMEAYFQLSYLLRQLSSLLDTINIHDVIKDVACHGDVELANSATKLTQDWRAAYQMMKEHIDSCQNLMKTELLAKQSLIAFYKELKVGLPQDKRIEERICMLNTLLGELQKHKDSGLLEAISKL